MTTDLPKSHPTHYKDWPNDAGFNTDVEHRTPIALEITGSIPAYAAGTLFRTGPGSHKLTTEDGEFACSHWFDGFAHLYRFELVPTPEGTCTVVYDSRRQVDALIERVRKTGRLDGVTFGQKRDPCDTLFKKIKTTFEPVRARDPELVNVGVSISANVAGFPSGPKGNLVTFTDATLLKTHDPETLAPLGVVDQSVLHPSLTGEISSAHPEFDPTTGDVFNYNLKLGPKPVYRVFCTSAATGKTSILAKLSGKDAKAAYLHSFFLTENFLVLCIWPAYFASGGSWVLWRRNILDALSDFDPSAVTKWYVIDRHHGNGVVAKFESSAMFAFHTVNAYETVGKDGRVDIVCDIQQHHNLDILKKFYYDSMVSNAPGAGKRALEPVVGEDGMARYKLSGIPATGSGAAEEVLKAERVFIMTPSESGELPTINPAYHTKPHRYIYGVGDRRQSSFHDTLLKMDTETQTSVAWNKPGHTPGEPIFVADPAKTGEDDGVVLSVVLDGASGRSYLLVLDAKNWVEVGRAEVPVAVGFGFHGAHVRL
ncbi:carotenoid oxygenase [Mycena albidolilacea]|uniref:Carotenoid oxygenase n=1 Tax=Mycena albidolilacea TaxID=1033008 RepID=A0AAD7EQ51_9AGAR|nr:carotenoid oxygenase [Mycena albidolilacea]